MPRFGAGGGRGPAREGDEIHDARRRRARHRTRRSPRRSPWSTPGGWAACPSSTTTIGSSGCSTSVSCCAPAWPGRPSSSPDCSAAARSASTRAPRSGEVAAAILEHDVPGAAIVADGELVGVVTRGDALRALLRERRGRVEEFDSTALAGPRRRRRRSHDRGSRLTTRDRDGGEVERRHQRRHHQHGLMAGQSGQRSAERVDGEGQPALERGGRPAVTTAASWAIAVVPGMHSPLPSTMTASSTHVSATAADRQISADAVHGSRAVETQPRRAGGASACDDAAEDRTGDRHAASPLSRTARCTRAGSKPSCSCTRHGDPPI